jgi:hypothetical protein
MFCNSQRVTGIMISISLFIFFLEELITLVQILSMLNLSDISSKIRSVAMFVIVNL